jgi:hypothetical protein
MGFLVAPSLLATCSQPREASPTAISPSTLTLGAIYNTLPQDINPDGQYVFYIHGKIIEDEGINAVSPQYGPYEVNEILQYLSEAGFNVIAEIRSGPTDVDTYSDRLASQVKSLIATGVPSHHITVVGFSKGAAITILTSAKLDNPDLNFVLIAICGEDTNSTTAARLSGRILSLYEKSDDYGASCRKLAQESPGVTQFDEIEFSTGKQHGAFYAADPTWLDPMIEWIRKANL